VKRKLGKDVFDRYMEDDPFNFDTDDEDDGVVVCGYEYPCSRCGDSGCNNCSCNGCGYEDRCDGCMDTPEGSKNHIRKPSQNLF
jgi:hypothetical protein